MDEVCALLRRPTRPRCIGVFGGSFDPPHMGHIEVVLHALCFEPIDRIIVVPCGIHPFGKTMVDPIHRQEMATLAFSVFGDRVIVDPFELKKFFMGGRTYTIDTLKYIIAQHGQDEETQYRLLVGEDILESFHKWKDFEEVKRIAPLLMVPRSQISSTNIRNMLRECRDPKPDADILSILEKSVPASVANYIEEMGIYLRK